MDVEIKESAVSDAEFEDMKRFVSDYLSTSVENEDDGGRMRWCPRHSAEYRLNHILSVIDLATRIADCEDADMNVARVAALFRDISKLGADQEVHAEEGARAACEFPSSHGDYPDSFVDQVCQVASGHSYQGPLTDVSLETHRFIEADILDKIGADDIALMLLRMGYEARIHMDAAEMVERIFEHDRDASNRLETDTARSFAHQRFKRVKRFRKWFEEEVPETDHDGQFSG